MRQGPQVQAGDERVLRSYRRARTYPKTIRKLANVDLPYPITIPQLAVWVGGFMALWYSRPLWSALAGSMTIAVLLGVPTVAAILLRYLRLEGRSPVAMAVGVASLIVAPRAGVLNGHRIRIPRNAVYAARILIEEADLDRAR